MLLNINKVWLNWLHLGINLDQSLDFDQSVLLLPAVTGLGLEGALEPDIRSVK